MVAERGGRRKHENTPLGKTAQQKSYADAARDQQGEAALTMPPDPETLPADLLYQRERCYALAASTSFERWLLEHVAAHGIPLDNVMPTVTLFVLYVEAFLLAPVTWPHLYEDPIPEPEPVTENEALDAGLHIIRRKPRKRPRPTLPGCNGTTPGGRPCPSLRHYGAKYCPACAKREIERIRAEREAEGG